jgi:hypothetical protein
MLVLSIKLKLVFDNLNISQNHNQSRKVRTRNVHRDRIGPLKFIQSWSNEMFKRQFRI